MLLWRIDRRELAISLLATLGVVAVGPIKGILAAVILALLRFLQLVARPSGEVLGEVPGHPGFHALARHPDAVTTPGLETVREVFEALRARGVETATAGRRGEWLDWGRQRGYAEDDISVRLFPTLRSAARAYAVDRQAAGAAPPEPAS